MTDRTDPYEIIGVRRDASLAEIRISYRRSTQILAPERFASANETVRAEAARRLGALNGAMETIEAERAAESGSALGSLSFGGPAVSPAAEPSLRAIAVVDEPPPLAPPAPAEPEAEPLQEEAADVSDVLEDEPPAVHEDVPEPAEEEPEAEAELGEPETGEHPVVADGDTEDGLPVITDEDLPREPAVAVASPAPAPAPAPTHAPEPVAPRFDRGTREPEPERERSLVPRLLAAAAVLAGLAAVGAYFFLGSGSSSPSGGQFQRAGAPVAFDYPSNLALRPPPKGGLLKPAFSTAVGVDGANYVVVATYRISADVQADGSAIGTGGSRLTADRFDESVDRAAARIAAAQKLKANGPAQPGKAGDLIARIYDYTRPDGRSARYAFAFRGHTEYSIACFWDPGHAKALSAACTQVMTSLQRQS